MDERSRTVELFRILYTSYEITKGYVRHPIIIRQLAEILGYEMNDTTKYQYLVELFFHLETEWLLRKESSLGIVLSISGINEVEDSLLEPSKPTKFFPPNIRRFVDVNDSLISMVRKTKKARKDFLSSAYHDADGFETMVVSPFEIKQKLELEQDMFSRVYFYLVDDGKIKIIHSNGISITHRAKLEIENRTFESTNLSFWNSPVPDITISDDMVYTINKINSASAAMFGFEIFNNKAGPFRELRVAITNLNNDSKNKAAFITCLLSLATILGEINVKEIGKHVTTDNIKSIKILQELFRTKGIDYDESDFIMLRKVLRLRSTVPPVHSAETEFIQVLQSIGIQYPVIDWADAADICLKHVLQALTGLLERFR